MRVCVSVLSVCLLGVQFHQLAKGVCASAMVAVCVCVCVCVCVRGIITCGGGQYENTEKADLCTQRHTVQ